MDLGLHGRRRLAGERGRHGRGVGEIERTDAELSERAMGLNPTGRLGTPREVADAVVFVSSARASRISGTNLLVDGALTRGIQL